mgnify:CR=1 FL=1
MPIRKNIIWIDFYLKTYVYSFIVRMEIQNFNNYLIYDDGRVYSKNRNIFMKSYKINSGYYVVDLRDNNRNKKKWLVHRLVALHYVNNDNSNYDLVDHIDQNKTNNNKENLRWCNKSINGYNRGEQVNNKLGEKNIFYCNTHKRYIFRIKIDGKSKSKSLKTLEEAIEYRDNFTKKEYR